MFAGFVSVFSLGFQSRNVATGKLKSAMVTSFIIALSQGSVISLLVMANDWTSRILYGISGSLGIAAAMKSHDWIHRVYDARVTSGVSQPAVD